MSDTADHTDLRPVLGRAHEEVARLLADDQSAPLDLVAWLSAHIAAFEHTIYPAVRRLPDGPALIAEDRTVVTQLARTLRNVERRHSGDVLAAGLSAERLRTRVSELVQTDQAIQGRIVDHLERTLSPADLHKLAKAYESDLAQAPTRPHPHLSRGGLMFRLDALRDHLLDTMDGRHVPVPRIPRRRIVPGRWGSYLLGQQHQGDPNVQADSRNQDPPRPDDTRHAG